MGNCCDNTSGARAAERTTNMYEAKEDAADLEAPSSFGANKYRAFELSLPFARIDINTFCVYLKMAHQEEGNEGFVTLKTMRNHFKTPAWSDLENENSKLARFLEGGVFLNESKGLKSNEICTQALVLFALLTCPGKIADKTEHFFNEIQEGGTAVHKQVSAGDKDMEPVFEKIVCLATWGMFVSLSGEIGELYYEDECNSMRELVPTLLEDCFLEDVFGSASRLDTEEWVKKMVTTGKWVFDSD